MVLAIAVKKPRPARYGGRTALFGEYNGFFLSVPSAQTAAMERATKEKHWRESQDVDAMLDPSRMLVKNVRGQARLAPSHFKHTCNVYFRFGG
jgi:hypothetical protein